MILGKTKPINIEDEMRSSYLDYAMSVIVSRALPDVRDGLKPVHRRILYAMDGLNLNPGGPHKNVAWMTGSQCPLEFQCPGLSAAFEISSLTRFGFN